MHFDSRRQQGTQPRNAPSLGGCLVTSELHDSAAQLRPVWRASCGLFVVSAEVPGDENLRTSGAQQRSTQPKRLKERKRMPGNAYASGRNRCPSGAHGSAKLDVWSRQSACGALPDSCDMSTGTDSPVASIRTMKNNRCGGRGRRPHLRRLRWTLPSLAASPSGMAAQGSRPRGARGAKCPESCLVGRRHDLELGHAKSGTCAGARNKP